MITEHTRQCATCRAILPSPPAPPACDRCGRLHVPLVAEWHPTVRLFLAAAYTSRQAFLPSDSEQAAMEKLLRVTFNYAGSGAYGHPFGAIGITAETPAVELYPHAVKLATHWRAAGAPLTHDLLGSVGHAAGLIPSSHPTRRAS